jgi:hypothetical protein
LTGAESQLRSDATGAADVSATDVRPRQPSPLRIRWGRLRLWAIALFGIGLAPIIAAPFYGFHDWPAFWTAGHLVGTPDIVSADATIAWQQAHGLSLAVFPYPPPAAILLWPFAHLPFDVSFWLHAVVMVACAVGAGVLGGRVFGLPRSVAVLATLAWAPVTAAVVTGQNTPFALLLAMIAIDGLLVGRQVLCGTAIAALLYKPTIGLPLAGLLVLRRRWVGVATAAAGVVAWFIIGIWAAGGSASWPTAWVATVGRWLADDTARNADKAISVPGLVARLGAGDLPGYGLAVILVLIAVPRLVRAPLREAAAGALLVGLVASPHAWGYEAALLMPALWWGLAGGIAEPWRTRLLLVAFVLAPFWLVSRQTGISVLAPVVLGAYAIWVAGWFRPIRVTPAATSPGSPARIVDAPTDGR